MTLVWRRLTWRLGRKLYQHARRDARNLMETNGELRLQRAVVDALPRTDRLVVFDVGARVGDWSRALIDVTARRPGGCDLHAFEPVPDSRAELKKLLSRADGQLDLRINAEALSDECGHFPIYVPHAMAGTSTLHPDARVKYERVIEITASTVDTYCGEHGIDHIDLMKIDTEGNDLKVIRGAFELLRNGRIGVVQFEYSFHWINSRTYLKDVFDLLRDAPYAIAKICPAGLEAYLEWHPEMERYFEANYVLVHRRLFDALGCRWLRIGASNSLEIAQGPMLVAQVPTTAARG